MSCEPLHPFDAGPGRSSTNGQRSVDRFCPFDQSDSRAVIVKRYYDERRLRGRFLPANLLGEPGWDILLITYWSHLIQQRLSVSAVCGLADVPNTTALRHIEHLCDRDFLLRKAHPTDGRVTWLILSPMGMEAMDRYFDRLMTEAGEDVRRAA
jgi:DNA-binding MarR family transcriptional regulator